MVSYLPIMNLCAKDYFIHYAFSTRAEPDSNRKSYLPVHFIAVTYFATVYSKNSSCLPSVLLFRATCEYILSQNFPLKTSESHQKMRIFTIYPRILRIYFKTEVKIAFFCTSLPMKQNYTALHLISLKFT